MFVFKENCLFLYMDEFIGFFDDPVKNLISFADKNKGVVEITGLLSLIWSFIKALPKVISFFKVKSDLHPFYSWKEVRNASENYVETRGHVDFSALSDHHSDVQKDVQSVKLISFFKKREFRPNEDDQRFYLILADSGMGKTTFLINLYLRYSKKIVKEFNVDLMSLWHPKTWERLENYPEERAKNTFLLLDSLDEDPKALSDITGRLNEIIDRVWHFRKVIICCNTQLFASQQSEPSEISIPYAASSHGYHNFLRVYIQPFTNEDIIKYIKKRFSVFNLKDRKRAVDLIKKSSSLMERPLLLSFIDDLIATGQKYEYAYEVYDSLIDRWISREANLLASHISRDLFKKQLRILSKDFAYAVFMKYQRTNGFFLDEQELRSLIDSKKYNIDISVFKTKSLITRNETGLFKFCHFSIFEFFLAQAAIDPEYHLHEADIEGFKNAIIFYQEIFWNKEVLPFFSRSGGRAYTKMNNREIEISKILANGGLEKVDNLFVNGLKSLSLMLLSPLKNILTLQAIDTPIESYESIESLKKLQTLNFENCDISDVRPLRFLTELSSLHLKNGSITDIDALADLTKLQYLNLENNRVTNLSHLSRLTRLKRLNLVNNGITDLRPLKSLENLSFLFIAGNPIDASQIEELKASLPYCDIDASKENVYI